MSNADFYKRTATSVASYLLQEIGIRPGEHYRFNAATSGPRVLMLSLWLNPKYASKIIAMREPLSMAAMLDKDQSIRIGRGRRGTLALEIPKPKNLWFNISLAHLPRRRGLSASIGLDSEHRPTLIDFSDPLSPHCLTAGSTGSGKTFAQRLLVHDLASQNEPGRVGFLLVDAQKRGKWWGDFGRIPHLLHPIVKTETEALRVLSWAVAEVDRRADGLNGGPKHIFVCIDEVQSILTNDGVAKALKTLTAVGREYGLHCILGLQNPTSEMMGGTADLKRNMVTRLVGKVDSGVAAYAATGQKESGAELLTGSGDFLLVDPRGIRRLTTALLTTKDVETLPHAESIPNLDLSQYEDIDHVIEQADNQSKADPLNPDHVAVALATDRGITWLTKELNVGSTKAKRVRQFAHQIHRKWAEMGYASIPVSQDIEIEARYVVE